MVVSILTPVKWGIQWAWDHPWHLLAGHIILKSPALRGLFIDHLILLRRGAIAGAAGSGVSIFNRLIVPAYAAARPVAIRVVTRIGVGAAIAGPPVAVAAGVGITAAVIAGVHTAALQKVELVGPKARTVDIPFWYGLGKVQINPYMIGWGTVV